LKYVLCAALATLLVVGVVSKERAALALSIPVFTPCDGKIGVVSTGIGKDVQKGQPLFTNYCSDLLQAEDAFIEAVDKMENATRNLVQVQEHYMQRSVSQQDLEHAVSDQQTAGNNLRAARDTLRVSGISDALIDQIASQRTTDPRLVARSPITGRITAMNVAVGLVVHPNVSPALLTVTAVR
jgi:cobalt-zinc-cadmium efflux system membrane fusion protein